MLVNFYNMSIWEVEGIKIMSFRSDLGYTLNLRPLWAIGNNISKNKERKKT